MTEKELEIYRKVYNIVNENLNNNQMKFGYYEESFLKNVKCNAQVINVEKYIDLENEVFFQALFVAVYKRLPDEKELIMFNYADDKRVFQENVLRKMANSSVVAINQIRFVNNPYFEYKKTVKYMLLGKMYGLTDKSNLRVIGKKMPPKIQKVIRKVFL